MVCVACIINMCGVSAHYVWRCSCRSAQSGMTLVLAGSLRKHALLGAVAAALNMQSGAG